MVTTAIKASPIAALLGEIQGTLRGWADDGGIVSLYDKTPIRDDPEFKRIAPSKYFPQVNQWITRLEKLKALYDNADNSYLKRAGKELDMAARRLDFAKTRGYLQSFLFLVNGVTETLEDALQSVLAYTKLTTHGKPKYKVEQLVIKKGKNPRVAKITGIEWSTSEKDWLYYYYIFGLGSVFATTQENLSPAPLGTKWGDNSKPVRSNRSRSRVKILAAKGAFTDEIKKYISRINAGIQSVEYRHQQLNPDPTQAHLHNTEVYIEDLKSMLAMTRSLQTLLQKVSKWSEEDWQKQFGYMFGIPKGADAVQTIGENVAKSILRALALFMSGQPNWSEERKRLAGVDVNVTQLARVFGLRGKGE